MAGQPKQGLDFAGWNVRIFDDDERIDELIDAQGWAGFSIYFYLCMKAYATNGYFYEWRKTSPATTARRMGGGIKSETVTETLKLCLRIGLFDNGLYDRESILTNKEIQTRYMTAIEKRSPNGRTVNKNYWLLNSQETKAYVVIPKNNHSLPEDDHSLPEDGTKKSKVKESKVNKSKVTHGGKTAESEFRAEFEKLWEQYPRKQGKEQALKAYVKARKDGTAFDEVQRGLKAYNNYIAASSVTERYIKHGSTWFNQHSWQDSYVPSMPKPDYSGDIIDDYTPKQGTSYDIYELDKINTLDDIDYSGDVI